MKQEIAIRPLGGEFGTLLRDLVDANLPSKQLARGVNRLKQRFTELLRVGELTATVHINPSTFRKHFRQPTGRKLL